MMAGIIPRQNVVDLPRDESRNLPGLQLIIQSYNEKIIAVKHNIGIAEQKQNIHDVLDIFEFFFRRLPPKIPRDYKNQTETIVWYCIRAYDHDKNRHIGVEIKLQIPKKLQAILVIICSFAKISNNPQIKIPSSCLCIFPSRGCDTGEMMKRICRSFCEYAYHNL